jgi:hypothetical protein
VAGPGQLDLNVFEGDDFAVQLLFQHPDGSPFDFSDAEWEAVITKGNWSDEAEVSLAVDASGAAAGQLVLQLAHAVTETLVRRGDWRLTEIEPGGDRHTLLAGKVKRTNDAATGQNAVTVTVGPEAVTVVTTQAIGVSSLLAETQQRIDADAEEASAREEADAAHAAADPAHPAAGVSVAPGAGVVSEDVQAALAEITGFITSQEAGDSAAIAAEVASRISGDTALTAAVNAEITNRGTAEAAISAAIVAEQTARANGDTVEATARAAADAARAVLAGGNAFTGTQSFDDDVQFANAAVQIDPRHRRFGAIADGTTHLLSERYATLADAQAFYGTWVTSLTQTIDWAALQKACNEAATYYFTDANGTKHCYACVRPNVSAPGGYYVTKDPVDPANSNVFGVALIGQGAGQRIHNITADSDVIRCNYLGSKLIEKVRIGHLMLDGTGTGSRAIYGNLLGHAHIFDVDMRRHPGTALWTESITGLTLLDANSKATLSIQGIAAYQIAVEVQAGTNPNTFKLLTKVEGALVSTDDNLVMDSTSADYAPTRIAASVTASPYINAMDLFSDSVAPQNNPGVKASTKMPPAAFLGCGFLLAERLHCQPQQAVPCIVDKAGLSPVYIECRTRQGQNGYSFENTRAWTIIGGYIEDNSKGAAGTRAGVKCRNTDLYNRKRSGRIIGAYVENNSEFFVDADAGYWVGIGPAVVAGGAGVSMQLFDQGAGAGKKTLEITSLGQGLTIEVQAGTNPNTFKLLVYQNAVLVETWDNQASPAAAETALAASVYVRGRNLNSTTVAPSNNPKVAAAAEVPRFFWDAIKLDGGGEITGMQGGVNVKVSSAAGRVRVRDSSNFFGRLRELEIPGVSPPFDGYQLNAATNSWFDTDPTGNFAWAASGTGAPTLSLDTAVGLFGHNSKKVVFQPGGPSIGSPANSAWSRVNLNSTRLRDGAGSLIVPAAGDVFGSIVVAKFDRAGVLLALRHDAGGTGSNGFTIESDTDWIVAVSETLSGATGAQMRVWAHSLDPLVSALSMWVGAHAAGQNVGGRLALINTELPAGSPGELRVPSLRVARNGTIHGDLNVLGTLSAAGLAAGFVPTPLGRPKTSAGTVILSKPGVELSTVSTQALTSGQVRYEPFWVDTQITLDRLFLEVTTAAAAGSKARLAIVPATTDWQPATTGVIDCGEVAVDAVAVVSLTIAQVLTQGRWLIAINTSGTPTLRAYRGGSKLMGATPSLGASALISSWTATLAYAAYADPLPGATAGTAATPFVHTVLCRVSVP